MFRKISRKQTGKRQLANENSDDNVVNLLAAGLDFLEEGFAIFDRDLVLLSRNVLFCELRGYPDDVCRSGATMESLIRFNADRGDYVPEEKEQSVSFADASTILDHRE